MLFKVGQQYGIWTSPRYGPDEVAKAIEKMHELYDMRIEANRLFPPAHGAEGTDGNQRPCQWACF